MIFLDTSLDARDQLRLLGVQASLLAAGSLDRRVLADVRRQRGLAPRYLAVEGHRALASNHDVLPPWMRSMVDHDIAARSRSAGDSLRLARQDRSLRPARTFGAIDVRRRASRDDGDGGDADEATETALEADDAPDLADLLTSPVGGGGPLGRLLGRLLRPGRGRDGGGPPGADAPTHLAKAPLGLGHTVVTATAPRLGLDAVERTAATHLYPEWDERTRAYRPDWCHVVEDVAREAARASTAPPDAAALRRALARLGTGHTPFRRRRQGEDIDIDAVVEARVGLLAGVVHTDDVYIESLRRRRDLSVLVLLDISGSAAEPGAGRRTVHEHQREAAALLTTALHELADRVALYAFNSSGRKDVRVTRVKGFDDRLDGRTWQRLDGLRPGAFTRLGAAIRHGSAVLEAHGGTPRRLLLVLSDGFAYDHGYEGRYGEADARRALLEARRRGIGCLCLSIGADADLVVLRRVFGATAHAALPSADRLPSSAAPLFAAALRAAETRR